ncbi:ubiquitin carboxyl-terminal hydrolase 7 [Vigna unguiculata]|uniref:Ubiquitin carboxyl-terminal hydrolase 7 n=2 Tax=Vigna unguiculata TaxID=3917 RepID=A0A4D6MWN7_VIGUN|nr:ubiquitin carboxyl-terminal hydrolase 7 [Vigna unguiculata]
MEVFGKFTWTITNFSTLDSEELYSDTFTLDGHSWRVFIYPKGNKVSVCQFIWNSGAASMPQRWEKFANFKFILINQLRHRRNIMEEVEIFMKPTDLTCVVVPVFPPSESNIVL